MERNIISDLVMLPKRDAFRQLSHIPRKDQTRVIQRITYLTVDDAIRTGRKCSHCDHVFQRKQGEMHFRLHQRVCKGRDRTNKV